MDSGRIVFTIIGFSASFFLCLPTLKKRQIAREKLKMVSEALEYAEERVTRYEERHDRILGQLCSFYLVNPAMEAVLAASQDAMNEASEFAVGLRKLQLEVISSYPGYDAAMFGWLCGNTSRHRNN